MKKISNILNIINISLIFLGIFSCFLSYNLFFKVTLYRIKDEADKVEKIYVINEEKAQREISEYEQESEEEGFNIINFIEKLNGDFTFDY